MNATELYRAVADGAAEFKATGIFYCEKCRVVHRDKDAAEKCCEPKTCAKCGSAEVRQYWSTCTECDDKARAEREAATIASAQKLDEWIGPVYHDKLATNEGFSACLSDFIEYWYDEESLPEFVFVCIEEPISFDIDWIIENATQDWPEELAERLDGREEFQAAIDAFCERNKKVACWRVDEKRMVRVPKREAV